MFGFFKNKRPPNNASHQIASSITNLLNTQLLVCKSSNKIGDDWAIGYFGGFIDQVCIFKSVKHDERGVAVMLLVLGSIFGEKDKVMYFNKYQSLVESNNKAAIEGDRIARNEVVRLLNGSSQRALGLSSYCHDMLDQYLEMVAASPVKN